MNLISDLVATLCSMLTAYPTGYLEVVPIIETWSNQRL